MSSSKESSSKEEVAKSLAARTANKIIDFAGEALKSKGARDIDSFIARGATELARGLQGLPDSVPVVDYPSIESSSHVHEKPSHAVAASEHLLQVLRGIQQQPYVTPEKEISK